MSYGFPAADSMSGTRSGEEMASEQETISIDVDEPPVIDEEGRCSFWIDLYSGEPVAYRRILADLMDARVVYVGERHTLARHHAWQEKLLRDMSEHGKKLVLGLEQMEVDRQSELDRYWRGEIDFEELAEATDWENRWSNYEQYRGILEAAREHGMPILALNARREIVRQVARKGLDGLDPDERAELPDEFLLDQPMYRRHMDLVMQVMSHAMGMPGMLERMYQAQVSRDETMAEHLCRYLLSEEGRDRDAIVLAGSGHVQHGLGIPARVRTRIPDVRDRILILSASGDLVLSERELEMVSDMEMTHEDLRQLQAPLCDYLLIRSMNPDPQTR